MKCVSIPSTLAGHLHFVLKWRRRRDQNTNIFGTISERPDVAGKPTKPPNLGDRDEILRALRRLGELAREKKIELELSIYGGCAMMLAFDRRAITRDVDAIFHPRDTVAPLIAQVAEERE